MSIDVDAKNGGSKFGDLADGNSRYSSDDLELALKDWPGREDSFIIGVLIRKIPKARSIEGRLAGSFANTSLRDAMAEKLQEIVDRLGITMNWKKSSSGCIYASSKNRMHEFIQWIGDEDFQNAYILKSKVEERPFLRNYFKVVVPTPIPVIRPQPVTVPSQGLPETVILARKVLKDWINSDPIKRETEIRFLYE